MIRIDKRKEISCCTDLADIGIYFIPFKMPTSKSASQNCFRLQGWRSDKNLMKITKLFKRSDRRSCNCSSILQIDKNWSHVIHSCQRTGMFGYGFIHVVFQCINIAPTLFDCFQNGKTSFCCTGWFPDPIWTHQNIIHFLLV